MKNYPEVINDVKLFKHINEMEINLLLNCLNVSIKHYGKNEIIALTGDAITKIGVVLNGEISIIKEDINGNTLLIATKTSGELFAEGVVCAELKHMPISIISTTESHVMFIDYNKILRTCSNSCVFHTTLIKNMLSIIANDNIYLNKRIYHLSRRTIREKIMSYLNEVAIIKNRRNFIIPYNREQLANYLSVDRSSLSRELASMHKEGIIDYNKKQFKLL